MDPLGHAPDPREAVLPLLRRGREGRSWGLSYPQLPALGLWGHQGLELCSTGLCWPPAVVLMLNFYK